MGSMVLAASSLSCAAHEEAGAYHRLGVRLADSELEVWYRPCAGENVRYIRLYQLDKDRIPGDTGDAIVWEAFGKELAILSDGVRLPGLVTVGPRYWLDLGTRVDDHDELADYEFTRTELEEHPGIHSGKGWVDVADYQSNAAESCD